MHLRFQLMGMFLFLCQGYAGYAQELPARKTNLPVQLREVSGLWIAGSDQYWWLADSGNPPVLYLTGADGALRDSAVLPLRNRDWEELTGDDKGNFYIGDFGNNSNARRDLRIYIYRPGAVLDSILFTYPDQPDFPPASRTEWSFDCEAMVWWKDSLHLFSKDAFVGKGRCKHYVIPARPGTYTARLAEQMILKKSAVTGAALDASGQQLALVSYHFSKLMGKYIWGRARVHLLTDFSGGMYFNGRIVHRKAPYCLLPMQFESIDFWNEKWLLVAAEDEIFQQQQFRRKRIPRSVRRIPLTNASYGVD